MITIRWIVFVIYNRRGTSIATLTEINNNFAYWLLTLCSEKSHPDFFSLRTRSTKFRIWYLQLAFDPWEVFHCFVVGLSAQYMRGINNQIGGCYSIAEVTKRGNHRNIFSVTAQCRSVQHWPSADQYQYILVVPKFRTVHYRTVQY